MKTEIIEKILKDAGIADDKIKDTVSAIFAENGKDVEAEKAKTAAKDGELEKANETISGLQETIKKFDGKDPEKLQADMDALRKKYDDDITAEKKKTSDLQKTMTLKEALSGAGVLDAEYLIYKHGGIDKFAFSDEGKPIGLDDTLKPYRESNPTLFKSGEDPEGSGSDNSGVSSFRVNSGGEHGGGGAPDYDKMSDAEYYAAISKK